MTGLEPVRFVAHLADGERPFKTACGEPWQRWQEPRGAGAPDDLPERERPREGVDVIRQCQACFKEIRR